MKLYLLGILLFILSLNTYSQEKTIQDFSVKKLSENEVEITFTLLKETDITLAVLNKENKIVRHLAGGYVSKSQETISELKKELQQTIKWDYKDDLGKDLPKENYNLRLTAGTSVEFQNYIGGSPYIFGAINSMAVDEEGNIYLMAYSGGFNQNMDTLRAFTAKGKYKHSIIPFSSTLKPETITNVAEWNESRKTFMPKNQRSQLPEFYPWGANPNLISASLKNGLVLIKNTDVYKMDIDGSNIQGPYPMWKKDAGLKNAKWNIPQLAVSPDGKYLYIANVAGTRYQPKGVDDYDKEWPQGRVYRKSLENAEANPEVFFDLKLPDYETTKYWLPDAWNKRTAAYGLAVDAKGHVYIGDLVNQAVVEVDPTGKQVSSTPVPWPERIHVDDSTGNLYVISRNKKPLDGYVDKTLHLISGKGDAAKTIATLDLSPWKGIGVSSTLAKIDGKSVLWLAGSQHLKCFGFNGEIFQVLATDFAEDNDAQQDWNRLETDYQRDEIYASNGTNLIYRYDGKSGQGNVLKKDNKIFHGVDIAVGYNGELYIRTGTGFSGPLERFDHELNPLPFSNGTHILSGFIYSRYGVGNCEKGLGVGPKGECYINYMYGWNKYFLAGFSGDGKVLQGNYLKGEIVPDVKKGAPAELTSAIVGPIPAACGGVKVDIKGNIYVGMRLQPKEYNAITGYEKNPAYATWTGCIAKFPKEGGTFVEGNSEETTPKAIKVKGGEVIGASKLYPGVAPFSGGGYGGQGSSCVCRVPRFDVDPYGRICYSNAVTNSVVIIDNAGNLICEFGSYGNLDENTDPEKIDKNKFPMAWPIGAGFTQNNVYVMDAYNKRIVKTGFKYQEEKTLELK